MPPNFLANLGAGMRNFGAFYSPEFETGARLGSGLRDRFKKRPGEPGSSPMTPTAPTPISPVSATDMLESATAAGEESARSKLPISAPAYPDPMRELMMGELRAGGAASPELPNVSPRSQIPITASSPPTVPNMPAPKFEPETLRDYRGRDVSNDRVGFERDIYMRGKMEPGGGFKRSLGMTLRNAMLGASNALQRGGGVEGAIGGALAGAGGSLINPRAGYEVGFELGERPRLEAEMAREQAAKDRANLEILNQAKLEGIRSETGLKGAQTAKARAETDILPLADERARMLAESQVRLHKAEIEAKRTGQAKLTKLVNPETGQIEEVWVFPDSAKIPAGPSGEAEMERRRDAASMARTKYSEGAATSRTGMTIAGEDRRTQARIASEEWLASGGGDGELKKPSNAQGGVTPEQIRQIISEAKKRGQTVTEEQVRARLQARGQ